MKKIINLSRHNAIITALLVILSISNYNCKNKPVIKRNDLKFFSEKYPDAKFEYDSSKQIKLLNFYSNNKYKSESLVFNDRDKLIEYVFYNLLVNEPRFIVTYDEQGNPKELEGDPVFIGSKYFKKNNFAIDSFSVQIYLATPPKYKAEFSIFKAGESNKFIQLASHLVKTGYSTTYIGKIDKHKSQIKYVVISKLSNEYNPIYNRTDTTYFDIKSKP